MYKDSAAHEYDTSCNYQSFEINVFPARTARRVLLRQWSSEAFTSFASAYKFRHTTSSTRFPQANVEVERAVATVKAFLRKCEDSYMALLSYRPSPLSNGYSPAELPMARKIRTNVPMVEKELIPKQPNVISLADWERKRKEKMKQWFDRHHKARELPQLSPGTGVWIPDQKQFGSVISSSSNRSYLVNTPTRTIHATDEV